MHAKFMGKTFFPAFHRRTDAAAAEKKIVLLAKIKMVLALFSSAICLGF